MYKTSGEKEITMTKSNKTNEDKETVPQSNTEDQ